MSAVQIKIQRPHVDAILAQYAHAIGKDLPCYRNHVYRTITYAMHLLGDAPQHQLLVETAFAYHDMGLWVDRSLAYLEPSETLALTDNAVFGWNLNESALRGAIHWHHKILPYRGEHAEIIEACRKADWIDVSRGFLRKGLKRAIVRDVEAAFPNLGFHGTLLRLTKEYGGSTLVGGFRVTRSIVKW